MKKYSISASFDKLLDNTFIAVSGVLVEREGTGFRYHGQYFSTEKELKEYIWKFRDQFNASINRVKK